MPICLKSKTIADAVDEAIRSADVPNKEKGTVVVVCGSVFLMSEARTSIGISEPQD